tara:strand:+ start:855 stop:2537 length:1683 start_codon:yes stop_codon:yes gene_type:complete
MYHTQLKMDNILKKENYVYFLLTIFIIIGLFTFTDYGIGIEEHFQRKSGFYWLNFLLQATDFENLKGITQNKINEINVFTPNLFPIEKLPFYGILFDLPLAFIEVFFNIKEPINYFYLRHLVVFFTFTIAAFCFYKLILNRFKNYYVALIGLLIYCLSPRIYGNIFFDGKDLFFLSIFTINIFFYFRYVDKPSAARLFLFSLFCALSTTTRIIGLFIPLSFFLITLLDSFTKSKLLKNSKLLLIFLFIYIIVLFLHWPYLWTFDFSNWKNFFKPFFFAMNPIVYFNNEYYYSKYLPIYYLPLWIFMTTPAIYILLFFNGFYLCVKRSFNRLTDISDQVKLYISDFWRGIEEKKDMFILINFMIIILFYFLINPSLLSGWRHFYFVNFFISYYSCFSVYIIFKKILKLKTIKIFALIILSLFFLEITYKIYLYHPYQSSYFNNLVSDNMKKGFEIDTQSLSRNEAINEILNDSKHKKQITIATASWTPLEDARSLIPSNLWDKLVFSGTSNKENADYIYTNYYYEINNRKNKKYNIPENFYLYKSLIVDGTRIYSIYKKKD